jgi:hypothetical protein
MRTNREPADASKLSPAQPGITHQQPSNAICYSPACIERWIRQGGSAVLVVDKQGRRGIVCEPGCRGVVGADRVSERSSFPGIALGKQLALL